jgi:hypothetical protein
MITEADKKKLGEKIQKHSELYPNLPLKAEQFESLFSEVFGTDWVPNNHNTNEDMTTVIEGMERPSLKSGPQKDGSVKISSHRTTTHKTLQEKIKFLDSRTYDSYVCLSRPDKKKTHKYQLLYLPKSVIKFDSLIWIDTYNKKGISSGWKGKSSDNLIEVDIVKSMSDQVWIKINMKLLTVLAEYDFT